MNIENYKLQSDNVEDTDSDDSHKQENDQSSPSIVSRPIRTQRMSPNLQP